MLNSQPSQSPETLRPTHASQTDEDEKEEAQRSEEDERCVKHVEEKTGLLWRLTTDIIQHCDWLLNNRVTHTPNGDCGCGDWQALKQAQEHRSCTRVWVYAVCVRCVCFVLCVCVYVWHIYCRWSTRLYARTRALSHACTFVQMSWVSPVQLLECLGEALVEMCMWSGQREQCCGEGARLSNAVILPWE